MSVARDLDRVVVVGTTGAGKTTFARRLAARLGAPHVELDALYWGPGWTRHESFQRDVLAATKQPRWVIDGNYRVFARALLRTVRRVTTGERSVSGNRETVGNQLFDREGVVWWAMRTYRKRRREFPELFDREEYAHASVVRLATPSATEAFLTETSGLTIQETRPDE
jgi:ATPase subunit of ABC transporter with duplicated ATPase domains